MNTTHNLIPMCLVVSIQVDTVLVLPKAILASFHLAPRDGVHVDDHPELILVPDGLNVCILSIGAQLFHHVYASLSADHLTSMLSEEDEGFVGFICVLVEGDHIDIGSEGNSTLCGWSRMITNFMP